MNEQVLTKQQWIDAVYELLCKSQGQPENEQEEKNLREWAECMASDDGGAFYADGYLPKDAHDEELSCG